MSYFARHTLELDFSHLPKTSKKERHKIREFVLSRTVPSLELWGRTFGELCDSGEWEWPRSRRDLAILSSMPEMRNVLITVKCYGEDGDIWVEYALDGNTEFQRPTITFPPTNLLPDKDSD